MEYKGLISVIVPVYNVEKYLEKCIKSIINQTYHNLEIILVNDGSKDNSGKICDFWEEKDPRIKVIHKENGGLSDARNTGMKIAKGEYIGFVDSDDYINSNFYEILMMNINRYKADISTCSIRKFSEEEVLDESLSLNEKVYTFITEEALSDLIDENILNQTVWNKLYKREVINNIYFEFGKIHEDVFWTYQVFGNAKKVVFVNQELYYYLQRLGSIMNSKFSKARIDALEAKANRVKYMEKNFPSLVLKAKKNEFFFNLYLYQWMLRTDDIQEGDKCKQLLQEYLTNLTFTRQERAKLSLQNKIWINLANISLGATCKIRNMLKIGM